MSIRLRALFRQKMTFSIIFIFFSAEVWKLKGIQDQFMSLRDESISSALKEFRNQVKRRDELGNRLKKINYDFDQRVNPHQVIFFAKNLSRFCK